jgi:hypothetical protein
MKAELVFQFDEVGISEREDGKDKKLDVSNMLDGQIIHYTSRNVRHISMIISVTSVRESLTASLVRSQDSEPVRLRLMNRGVRLYVALVFRPRSKSQVNGTLFLKSINNIFVRCLNGLRESDAFEACEAELLMNDSSP